MKPAALVRTHFEDPNGAILPETWDRIAQATADLYYGPGHGGDDYPGFVTACKEIREGLEDVDEVWVDTLCDYVCEREPDWQENCPEDFVHYSRADVIEILVGKELAPYVRWL